MHASSIAAISPGEPPVSLPIRIRQSPSRPTCLLMLGLVLPAAAAFLSPFVLLAGHLVGDAGTREVMAGHPGIALRLALALGIWAALFGWPIKRLVRGLFGDQTVEITAQGVTVTDHGPLGARVWHADMSEFRGVSHHIRASLSGSRHELVLAHPKPSRSVVLAAASRLDQSEIDNFAKVLGHVEISSRDLYRLPWPSAVAGPWGGTPACDQFAA